MKSKLREPVRDGDRLDDLDDDAPRASNFSGCYAYQVDGTDFSLVIVFRAVIAER